MGGSSVVSWKGGVDMHGWIEWRCMGGSGGSAWLERVEEHG